MSANPLLLRATQLLQQARDVRDRYSDDRTPTAEDARQIKRLLSEAKACTLQAEQDAELKAREDFLSAPQYRHPNVTDSASAADYATKGHAFGSAFGSDDVSLGTKAFLDYVRKGTPLPVPPEHKADLVEDATGQSVVPTDFAGTIVKDLARLGIMRGLAYVRPTTSNVVDLGSVSVGTPTWRKLEVVGTPADALAATPAAKATVKIWDLTALALVGYDELADADSVLESVIRRAVAEKLAEVEDDAYFGGLGDGSTQPWAVTHNVTQTLAAAVSNTPTPDDVKAVQWKVPARHRAQGVYVMHSKVEQAVALWKDNNGNYLLQPASAAGEPPTLFGKRLYVSDALADPSTAGTTDKSVVFGDLSAGYMIADRQQLRVQRLVERYAEAGKIGLLFTLRVGGDTYRPSALATYTL